MEESYWSDMRGLGEALPGAGKYLLKDQWLFSVSQGLVASIGMGVTTSDGEAPAGSPTRLVRDMLENSANINSMRA